MTEMLERFPLAPIAPDQREVVTTLCGGSPPTIDGFRNFLQMSGLAALPERWQRDYIQLVGLKCLRALDINAEPPNVRQDFNRGALFYAGTVREIGCLDQLPHNKDVYLQAKDVNDVNLGITAQQEIEGLDTFLSLLNRFKSLFPRTTVYDGFSVAMLGAGFTHILTRDSLRAGHTVFEKNMETPESADDRTELLEIEYQYGALKDLFDSTLAGDVSGTFALLIASVEQDGTSVELPPLPKSETLDRRAVKSKGLYTK